MTTWHKGPPPSIGWWPAGIFRDATILRWWNGKSWSTGAHVVYTAEEAAETAAVEATMSDIRIAQVRFSEAMRDAYARAAQ
jgi:hypothetical protein